MEGSSSSRRSTRAALAPSWTTPETLTLLHQISAVDRECRGAIIASFQKWKTISANLSSEGIYRSLDQCRRKWNSLLDEYKKVKELGSFWDLDDDVRVRIGVSSDFDLEVFRAMDDYLRKDTDAVEEEEEGERENEGEESEKPDAGTSDYLVYDDRANDLVEDDDEGDSGFQESGFEEPKSYQIVRKKRSRVERVTKQKKQKKGKKKKKMMMMKPQVSPTVSNEEVTDHQSKPEELKYTVEERTNPQIAATSLPSEEVDEEMNFLNEQKVFLATNHQNYEKEEVCKEEDCKEEEEVDEGQVLAEKILESAKYVKAIAKQKLSDNDNFLASDSRDVETDFVRHQGDQLIAYLGELARSVKQLCDNKHLCDDVQ